MYKYDNMDRFEPTLLPFNKKVDKILIDYESVPLNKSLIDDLCVNTNFDSDLLILAAICITLTKYIHSTEIFIRVDNDFLIFDDEDRDKSVSDYIGDIYKCLNQSGEVDGESFFNIIFDDVDVNGEGIDLFVGDNSLRLKFDSNKYTNYYIKSFLRSINKVINQFDKHGINKLKIKDIGLRDEGPVPKFKLKRNPLVNELLESQANKTPDKVALRNCGESYTFKEINDEANKIANALIGRGFKEGSSIAVPG